MTGLLVAACATEAETPTTTTGSGPTTSLVTSTTVRPQLVDGGLVAADPATLIPYEDSEPIIIGRDHTGTVSEDGSKTVVQTLLSNGSYLVTVLETETWEFLASDEQQDEPQLLTVGDKGAAYWLTGGADPGIHLLGVGADSLYTLPDQLPKDFTAVGDSIELLDDNSLGLFGHYHDPDVSGRLFAALIVSPDGTTVRHDLPAIDTEVEIDGEPFPVLPDYAWDVESGRLLVVEATRDVVHVLDLESGVVTQHPWDGIGPATHRDVVLSPNGSLLFVASANHEVKDNNLVRTPQDLVVLDAVDWASGEVVDIAVDQLYPSSDNLTLLAQGAEVTSTVTETSARPSPVYLLDMTTAEVSLGFQVSDTVESAVQYSADGAFAYLANDQDGAERYAILDVGGEELVGTAGFNRFSLIGPAGLVAFHQQ